MSAQNWTRPLLLFVFFLCVPWNVTAQDIEKQDDWTELEDEVDLTFTAPPVKAHFSNLDKELKISRRDPFTGAARNEIAARRQKQRLKRQQVFAVREKREGVVTRLGRYGGDRAAHVLIQIYEKQLGYMEIARKNVDRHNQALTIDINPGVDPGGLYWERWVQKYERPAARGVFNAERKIRDMALAECAKILSSEVRTWLARNAESHDWSEVREQMIGVLAASGEPEDAVTLGQILMGTTESWLRVVILDALAANQCQAAEQFVLGALGADAWPVQSAAIDAIRALDLRGANVVDLLVRFMVSSDGRLQCEARNALSVATGQSFGLIPEEWELWWGANREGWEPTVSAFELAPLPDQLASFCGKTTASKRIAFIIPGGRWMKEPTRRRATANDGSPSPEPAVDTALKIAAWELEEALKTLPKDALFTVIVLDKKPEFWSKKLKKVTKDAIKSATRFVLSKGEKGGGNSRAGVEAALMMGVKRKADDIALAGPGDVDTIYLLWGYTKGYERIIRLRRVDMKWARLPAK